MEGELFRIGPIALYSYGCALAAAFLAGTAFVVHEAARRRIDVLLTVDLVIRLIVVGVVAGRFGYCLPDIDYYLTHPWEFINTPQGGLSFYPAFLAAIGYLYWFTKRENISFWSLLDALAPGLAVGLIIGFLGAAEVQPIEGAFQLGSLYWPPPTLTFFTVEFAGLWYLAASRRRLAPGRRFSQVVTVDAIARLLSSSWAWAIYGEALPHALSVALGSLVLCGAVYTNWKLRQMPVFRAQKSVGDAGAAVSAGAAMPGGVYTQVMRRKRLPVRMRLLRAAMWLGVYVTSVVLLSRGVVD